MTLVSIASMPAPNFSGDARVHLFDRHGWAGSGQRAKNVFETRDGEEGGRLEQDAFGGVLDREPGSGSPPPPVPYRLGQDHLALGRYYGRQPFGGGHEFASP